MDVFRHSAFERLEIVETGRRRRWSDDEKLRIVLKSQSAPRLVSATARRYGTSRSQLGTWLRSFRAERDGGSPGPAFVPAVIALEPMPMPGVAVSADGAAIVVELPTGGRVRLAASMPAAFAEAVLGTLR